ncbi:hypothetical protein BH10ACI3_BH10ACI3_17000 [soil metagenome]
MSGSNMGNVTPKQKARCSKCDREMDHYNTFLSPTNEESVVCWECMQRKDKGFNATRGYHRQARSGVIVR